MALAKEARSPLDCETTRPAFRILTIETNLKVHVWTVYVKAALQPAKQADAAAADELVESSSPATTTAHSSIILGWRVRLEDGSDSTLVYPRPVLLPSRMACGGKWTHFSHGQTSSEPHMSSTGHLHRDDGRCARLQRRRVA